MASVNDTYLSKVEYQATPNGVWYEASLTDITPDGKDGFQLHLSFANNVWSARTVDPSCVRNVCTENHDLDVEVGAAVEVWVANDTLPAMWSLGRVDKVHGEFIYATLDGTKSSTIVEKRAVRLPSTSKTYAHLTCPQTIPLQKSVSSWATSDDAIGCFSSICAKTGLLFMAPSKDNMEIVLLGSDAAIRRAEMLLNIHLKHQNKIAEFHKSRMRQLDHLTGLKAKVANMQSIDVLVPQECIPKIIGSSGGNIKRIQEKHNVTVRILDEQHISARGPNGEIMKCVRILGKTNDDCLAAKVDVEFIEVHVPITHDQYGWLLGTKGETIKDLKEKSGVQTLTLERNKESILLYGSRPAVEDAQALIDTHMLYFPVFHQIDKERQLLNDTLTDLHSSSGNYNNGWYRNDWGSRDEGKTEWRKGKEKKSDYEEDGDADARFGNGKKGYDDYNSYYGDDYKYKGGSKPKGRKKKAGYEADNREEQRKPQPNKKDGKAEEGEAKTSSRPGKGAHRRGAQNQENRMLK